MEPVDTTPLISFDDFLKVDIRFGTIVSAQESAKAGLSVDDRLWPRHRPQEIFGANHQTLSSRGAGGASGRGRRHFSAKADRILHVRGSHARLSRRERRSRADRAEPAGAQWRAPVLADRSNAWRSND